MCVCACLFVFVCVCVCVFVCVIRQCFGYRLISVLTITDKDLIVSN